MHALLEWLTQNRVWQKIATLIFIGIAVHLILPQITALENSWQVLISLRYWAVGLAFIAQFLSYLGNGYLLLCILAVTHQMISLWKSTLIVFGAASIGMVAGGMVGSSAATYRWISGTDRSLEGAALASFLFPLFNNIVLVLVSIFGLVHLLVVHSLTQAQIYGFGITLLILGIIIGSILLTARYRTQTTALILSAAAYLTRIERKSFDPAAIQNQAGDLFDAWDILWQGAWFKPVFGAILNVVFDMLTLYFLFIAAGELISPGVLVAGYGLPLLLGKLAFFLPGGVGVVESSMAVIYNGLGVTPATTVVVVLGYRLISFWIPSFVGFPIAALLSRSQNSSHRKPDSAVPGA
jgi:uncharacterized membrane protein YbhN (UPF0104 family)